MIDPKQKAIEIVEKFYNKQVEILCKDGTAPFEKIEQEIAKECAKIHIEGILEAIDWHEFETPNKEINYWQEVLTELNKM